MATVLISKLDIFELFEKNNYDPTQESKLINEVANMIEKNLNIKLVEPLSVQLKFEIKNKILIMIENWMKCKTDEMKQNYKRVCKYKKYKFNISTCDLEQEMLAREFQQFKYKCNELQHKNDILTIEKRSLMTELSYYKNELIETQKKLKYCVDNNNPKTAKSFSNTQLDFFNSQKSILITPIVSSKSEIGKNQANSSALYNLLTLKNNKKFKVKQSQIDHTSLKERLKHLVKFRRRKNYYQVKSRQQIRFKKELKSIFDDSTQFLKKMGLCLASVEINPIELDENDVKININKQTSEFNHRIRKPDLKNLLYFKDKFSISDRAYSFMKSKCHMEIPSLAKIKQKIEQLDSLFTIRNNRFGVFLSLEEKLRFRLESFFLKKYGHSDDLKNNFDFRDDIIHVKLSGDGTIIGRNLKLLNLTFTIINEGNKAKTASGNYTLGIFEIENEDYESITQSFKEIIDEIEKLSEMYVSCRKLKVFYYFGSDWKMLAQSLGILGANSKYPCVWCKTPKEEFYDIEKDYSIVDPRAGARTHEEMAAILNHPNKKAIVKYGHEKQPVFRDLIPIHRYIIDMLHLFLRISDSLINLLIKDCCLADKFDAQQISCFDVTKYKHINSFQHFLNEKCNIKYSFFWSPENKRLTWRDLVGPEKHRLFENFNLAEIIPGHEKFNSIVEIWKQFYIIFCDVKLVKLEPLEVKKCTADWLKLYLTVYNKTTITPYMHAFVSHLHEFVYLYKDINAFNCQGIEKLNDMSTNQFFRGTNKRESALHQMIKKRNRMEYLRIFVNDEENE